MPGFERAALRNLFLKIYSAFALLGGIVGWWLVLTTESRRVAQEESNRQTHLLMQEIEAHQRTDAQLQTAKQAAERANLAKSRYITGISHELRTPLNSILGYAQIVEHDPDTPPHRREAMTVIRRSGEHLVSLIDGLLDIAKIETGKLALEIDELRLPEFIGQLADMFRPQAHGRGIGFEFEISDRLPAVVRADKKRLGQILINILGNAVKFTERGSVTLRVRYRREMAVFEIEDSGVGISPADLQRIFLPFERGSNIGQHRDGGTGLGLTIAQMLSNVMGGELSAERREQGGSRFRLRLFLPEVRNPRPAPSTTLLDVGGYGGPRRRILIVDNEAVDRELLVNVLAPLGFDIAQAASGIEALRLVAGVRPDLILMDIGMPGIDGWETSRLLRSNRLSDAPIVVISASAQDKGRDNDAGIGHDDFLVKPVDVVQLLDSLKIKLKLEWQLRNDADAPSAAQEVPATSAPTVPPEEAPASYPSRSELAALSDLGSLGYVRGILEKLEEIERLTPDCADFIRRLRSHVQRFQMQDFTRLLERARQNVLQRS